MYVFGLGGTAASSIRLPRNQFEKVFVVSLPERSDKQDAMRLTASLTGFDFETIDGVKGVSLPQKALPGVSRYRSKNLVGITMLISMARNLRSHQVRTTLSDAGVHI